ncbi:MAG: hypothetical protein H7X70_07050 [Candidatus Kapabacteria bacterium]|nr:hypothetical protein [Candidatus Kapabacteria bacterium]
MTRTIRVLILLFALTLVAVQVQAQVSIRFNIDSLDLGSVPPCLGARDSFSLINDGTRVVPSPGASVIPGFRVEAENDSNILPGETRKMYVTFIGNTSVRSYYSRYFINPTFQGESSADTVWFRAERIAGRCCIFRIDTIRGAAGDDVSIRIMQDSTPVGTYLADVSSTMNIGYDASTIVPTGLIPQAIAQQQGSFTIAVKLRNDNGVLASIPARLTLGRVVFSEVLIVWHSNSDIRVLDTTYAGPVELSGVCQDGRDRLFDPDGIGPRVRVEEGSIFVMRDDAIADPVSVFDYTGTLIFRSSAHDPISVVIPCSRGHYFVSMNGRRSVRVFVP